jgi:erythromycin esterase-like protein
MEQQFFPASLPSMFDAIIYLEETSPAKPIR